MNDIFQDLEIENQENLKIEDIKYIIPLKEVHIVFKGNNILHFDLFLEIETKITEYLDLGQEYKVIYKYVPNNTNYEVNTLNLYYHNILNKNRELHATFKNIKIEVIKNENRVIFDLNSKFEQVTIEKKLPELKTKIENYGFSEFNYDFKIKEISEEYKKEMEEKIQLDEKKIIKTANTISKKPRSSKLFGEHLNSKISIKEVVENQIKKVMIEGVIFNLELRELKKTHLLNIMLKDSTGTISAKCFQGYGNRPPAVDDLRKLSVGMKIQLTGSKNYDQYAKEEVLDIEAITILDSSGELNLRKDKAGDKRVELHLHSKMSVNNGISSMDEYVSLAKSFGHDAIAITDHDGVQGFIDAEKASKKYGIKMLYGIEATVVDTPQVVRNATDSLLQSQTYTVFDLETTGLSANFNKIIEIGAVQIKEGEILKRYQTFIKIDEELNPFTTKLTGITDSDLADGIPLKKALEDFKTFYEGTTLVAHNATFDYQFLNKNEKSELNTTVDVPVLDTLELSRILNPENTFHSLKILTRKYGVEMDSKSHHRADYDSEKLAEMFIFMLKQIADEFVELKTLQNLNETNVNKSRGVHELIYAKNQSGLADLYKLISDAHTTDYLLEPRIRTKYIKAKQDNFIVVGSGCIKSKLIDFYLNKSEEELKGLIKYYDFIELHPKEQYIELIKNDSLKSYDDIIKMQERLIEIAKEVNTPVFASSNAHFVNPEDYVIKEILMSKDLRADKVKKNKGTGEDIFPDINKFNKLIEEKEEKFKHQYMHSTDEMLAAFDYLDESIREEIVIHNTKLLVDQTEELKIVPDELFTPEITGVDDKLKDMVYEKAKTIYSGTLPEIVEKRIEKETNSIIKYGFSVIYYISHKLVKYSLDNGYLVGSRGSVGSSLVATFMDITEINPLAPHYICPNCNNSEFFLNGEYASGFDLPNKKCPNCNTEYLKDGQDIPFETFLGFEGDKVPDIDLNFSGDFQPMAHDYVRSKDVFDDDELFDIDHAFRAGTIGTLAEKTAYAYTRNYFELKKTPPRKSDILYLSKKCEGIKRTTGQHPGGIIVVPNNLSIYEFTPIQFPANDKKQPWRTTHFDFHSIHDNLLKLDILGHDDPTMLKKLYDLTGVDPKYIDVSDPKIMELFTSTKSIGIDDEEYFSIGTLGVPEFGTTFVQEMLKDTKPKTFSELVQISGLSHGTDVWLGNAQELIKQGICTLKEVIGCRDDIMVYLMYQNIDPQKAFFIMENVRKGKGLTEEEITTLKENNIPEWYIQSCQKIKYMFPKAHAAAYVLMALRIAYYKVYYPLEYYCAYFTSRATDFDPMSMIKGEEKLKSRIALLDEYDTDLSEVKKKSLMLSLKMSLEMCERGYKFLVFDLEKSQAQEFIVDKENNGLIMPFGTIDGLGEKEAINIVNEREQSPFKTKEDLKKRTKIKAKTMEQLEYFNVLDKLEESNQTRLF